MRRRTLAIDVVFLCVLLLPLDVSTKGKKRINHKHIKSNTYNVAKKSTIEHRVSHEEKYDIRQPYREVPRKKSDIYGGHRCYDNDVDVEKHKRGFLANLASLLNDAEIMSAHKNSGNGLSAINANQPLLPEQAHVDKVERLMSVPAAYENDTEKRNGSNTSNTNNNQKVSNDKEDVNHTIPISREKVNNAAEPTAIDSRENPMAISKTIVSKKADVYLPTAEDLLPIFSGNSDEFAPIFAMYHGKIVPLGKLPETAFSKKSISASESKSKSLPEANKFDKVVTGSKRSIFDIGKNLEVENNHIVSKVEEKKDLSKLQQYLQTLDDPTVSSLPSKDTRDVAKDDVTFPETETPTNKPDILSHVKGVVLDDGKILTVKQHHKEDSTTNLKIDSPADDPPQKYYVTEDGNLAPLIKSKSEIGESTERDNTESTESSPSPTPDSQKTISLSLDVLRELLKKSDSKISLASLLNKTPDAKSETPTEVEEGDSDSSSKKTGNKLSLATYLNKTPEKSDSPKETEDDDPDSSSKKSENKLSLATFLNKTPEKNNSPKETEDEDPGTIEDFAAGGLKAHNDYRGRHHGEPLVWSDDIAAKAQKLAETLADKKSLEIAKDLEKEGFGENVAKVWATFKNAGEAATKMWYSQSDNYHFDDPHLDENTGQFAQVIWKSTKELGMGVAKSIDDVNNKYVYVTALYRPPGNVESILRENVLPSGNNTVDVYTTFFKRTGVILNKNDIKKSTIEKIDLKEKG